MGLAYHAVPGRLRPQPFMPVDGPPIGDRWPCTNLADKVYKSNRGGSMSQRHTQCRKPGGSHGFTLIELMVTVAVMVILAAIAAPNMTELINNRRAAGQTEELVASLQLARAEAIRRNARVTVCAGTGVVCNGSATWSNWTIFGRDKTADPADPPDVIRDTSASSTVQVTGPAAGIVYKPSGMIDAQQQLQVTKSSHQRCLRVLISGVVTVAKGAC
jgi:type IV fimbrial biogenesis protein FimT